MLSLIGVAEAVGDRSWLFQFPLSYTYRRGLRRISIIAFLNFVRVVFGLSLDVLYEECLDGKGLDISSNFDRYL